MTPVTSGDLPGSRRELSASWPPTWHSSCSRPLIRTSAISLYDIVLLLYYIGSTGLCSNRSDRNQCFCVLNCVPTVLTVNCQVDSVCVCSLNHPFHPFFWRSRSPKFLCFDLFRVIVFPSETFCECSMENVFCVFVLPLLICFGA